MNWLDGSARQKTIAKTLIWGTGHRRILCRTGRQLTDGWASQIAFYGGAMQEGQITARANVQVDLQGSSRCRNHFARDSVQGERKVPSSHFNGQPDQMKFSATRRAAIIWSNYDNRNVDLVVLNAQDPDDSIPRIRPDHPSEYEDPPT